MIAVTLSQKEERTKNVQKAEVWNHFGAKTAWEEMAGELKGRCNLSQQNSGGCGEDD